MSDALRLPKERVLALDPADIEAYVVAHGWKMDPELSSAEAGVYHLPADWQAEIVVPRNRAFADYALRIADALVELATAERRTAWEVMEDLTRKQAEEPSKLPAPGQHGRGNGARATQRKRDAS